MNLLNSYSPMLLLLIFILEGLTFILASHERFLEIQPFWHSSVSTDTSGSQRVAILKQWTIVLDFPAVPINILWSPSAHLQPARYLSHLTIPNSESYILSQIQCPPNSHN